MHIYIKNRPNSVRTDEIMLEGPDLVYLRDDGKLDRINIMAIACVISDARQEKLDEADRLLAEADLAMQADEIEYPRVDETAHYRSEG